MGPLHSSVGNRRCGTFECGPHPVDSAAVSLVLLPFSCLPERELDGSDGSRGGASKHHPPRAGETDLSQSHLSCRQLTGHLQTHICTKGRTTDNVHQGCSQNEHTYSSTHIQLRITLCRSTYTCTNNYVHTYDSHDMLQSSLVRCRNGCNITSTAYVVDLVCLCPNSLQRQQG